MFDSIKESDYRQAKSMGSPREQLEPLLQKIRKTPGNDAAQRAAQLEANVECAIVVADALIGLQEAIDKATAQAKLSSDETAKLSKKLNQLTIWIIAAAVLSAAATTIQAIAALVFHKG